MPCWLKFNGRICPKKFPTYLGVQLCFHNLPALRMGISFLVLKATAQLYSVWYVDFATSRFFLLILIHSCLISYVHHNVQLVSSYRKNHHLLIGLLCMPSICHTLNILFAIVAHTASSSLIFTNMSYSAVHIVLLLLVLFMLQS